MTGTVNPFCSGMGCPLKDECGRYKQNIDYKNESHFAYAPYSHIEKRCAFKPKDVNDDNKTFLERLKKTKGDTN